jgi:hypothetical protein
MKNKIYYQGKFFLVKRNFNRDKHSCELCYAHTLNRFCIPMEIHRCDSNEYLVCIDPIKQLLQELK